MTVEGLMTQPATLMHLDSFDRGPAGGVNEPVYIEEDILGYFEPEAPIGLEGENIEERNTQLGRWFGAIPAGVECTGFDVIVYLDQVMDLTGPPRTIWNPRLGAASHQELSLRVVE